jgi:hypothetical protein
MIGDWYGHVSGLGCWCLPMLVHRSSWAMVVRHRKVIPGGL